MYLFAYGMNHKSAPLDIREQFACDRNQTPGLLKDLISNPAIHEAVLLSTCNRTEVYAASEQALPAKKHLIQHPPFHRNSAAPFCYHFEGPNMVRHLMRVASGLDSMMLGEPQILGQVKQAYSLACDAGTVGHQLRRLFPAVFAVSKQIRTQTTIGDNPVSIAYAVVQLAKQIFPHLEQSTILLIGAGETIELVATHLYGQGVRHFIIASRTVERARKLSDPFGAQPIRIGDIPNYLKKVDMVVTATASQLPLLGKGMMETVLRHRQHHPMVIADLAVPRDVEPEVGELTGIHLYNIDDLHAVITQNLKSREEAAKQAEAMIDLQAMHYMRQLQVIRAGDMIRAFRQQIEKIKEKELTKALTHLEQTNDPKEALSLLAHGLTNKIMHQPTVKLRQAAYHERLDLWLLAKDLFDL